MISAASASSDTTRDVEVSSQLLGDLDVPSGQVYTFAEGLYGFTGATSFALLPAEREGLFWLQSLDFEALTFLLLDPFQFVDGYSVELDTGELAELSPSDASEILVLAVLTLPTSKEETATANLQGPIALNVVKRRGSQIVLDAGFGLRYPVDLRSQKE